MNHREIVVDACCLLNVLATGRSIEIAVALGAVFVVTPHAQDETLCLHGPPDPEDEEQRPTREPADLSPFFRGKRLRVHEVGSDCADALVLCASHLRVADASSVAVAATLQVALASDDNKVRKVASHLYPQIEILSTLQLVREATERLGIDGDDLRRILRDLHVRGNFAPPKRDPERDWYEAGLASEEP